MGRLSSVVHVDVVAEHADGRRTVVSHFNKAHKGRLARALVTSRAEPDDAAKVAAIARKAGMRVERSGNGLTIVVDAAQRSGEQSPRDLHAFFMRHRAAPTHALHIRAATA